RPPPPSFPTRRSSDLRTPGRTATADRRRALSGLLNHRPEFLFCRHLISSHEHNRPSSQIHQLILQHFRSSLRDSALRWSNGASRDRKSTRLNSSHQII